MPWKGSRHTRRKPPPLASRPRVLAVLAGIVLTVAASVAATQLLSAKPPCQQVLVPAYFYPGACWTQTLTS